MSLISVVFDQTVSERAIAVQDDHRPIGTNERRAERKATAHTQRTKRARIKPSQCAASSANKHSSDHPDLALYRDVFMLLIVHRIHIRKQKPTNQPVRYIKTGYYSN